MKNQMLLSGIPITNSNDAVLTIGFEPEGDCVELAKGDTCLIRPIGDFGAENNLDFSIVVEKSITLVYLMCDKAIFINGVQIR